MKKPIHLAAVVFWWVGAIFIIADIPVMGLIHAGISHALKELNHSQYASLSAWAAMWAEARFAVLYGLQFIGVGVVIELVDQIRWNALPPEQRVPRRTLGDIIRRLRQWPGER